MATNSSFNLPKAVKLVAGSIYNKEKRRIFIKSMIDAQSSFIAGKSRKWTDPASSQKSRDIPKD